MSANLENSVAAGLEKDSFHTNYKEGNAKEYSNYRLMCSVSILVSKKGNAKGCSNYLTIVFISHASKVMLKSLQVRLQVSVN